MRQGASSGALDQIEVYFRRKITIDDIEAHEDYTVKKKMDIFRGLNEKEKLDEKTLGVLRESGIGEIIEESLVSPVSIGNSKKKELARKIMRNLAKLKNLNLMPEHLCKYLKNENYCETTFIKNALKELCFNLKTQIKTELWSMAIESIS